MSVAVSAIWIRSIGISSTLEATCSKDSMNLRARLNLEHLCVESLAHFYPSVREKHCAVQVDSDVGSSLVQPEERAGQRR